VRFPYSYRGYRLGMFRSAFEECSDIGDASGRFECEVRVRSAFRGFEGGRWARAMDALHRFMSALDSDEVERFRDDFPGLVDAVNEYAVVEGLRRF